MATYDNDQISLALPGYKGPLAQSCKAMGFTWPPPAFIAIAGGPRATPVYRRVTLSDVPDSDAARGVKRVAEYEHDRDEASGRTAGPSRFVEWK